MQVSTSDILRSAIIVCVIYSLPAGSLVTSGYWVYVYKACVSIFCIGLLFRFVGVKLLTIALVIPELIAVAVQILMLCTPFAHELHSFLYQLVVKAYYNYRVIPEYLFLAQVLILIIGSCGGFFRTAKQYINNYPDRNGRDKYNRCIAKEGFAG